MSNWDDLMKQAKELYIQELTKQDADNMPPEKAFALALENVMRDRKHVDTWEDVAQRVMIEMSEHATLVETREIEMLRRNEAYNI